MSAALGISANRTSSRVCFICFDSILITPSWGGSVPDREEVSWSHHMVHIVSLSGLGLLATADRVPEYHFFGKKACFSPLGVSIAVVAGRRLLVHKHAVWQARVFCRVSENDEWKGSGWGERGCGVGQCTKIPPALVLWLCRFVTLLSPVGSTK